MAASPARFCVAVKNSFNGGGVALTAFMAVVVGVPLWIITGQWWIPPVGFGVGLFFDLVRVLRARTNAGDLRGA
jgi:hypothetical protein